MALPPKIPRYKAPVTRGGRRIGKLKNEVRNFNLEQRRKVNATARSVAVQIMNDLARKGPEWSGEFKNSWEAVALGEGSKIGKSGSFPYKIGNIPRLSTKKEEIRRANKLQITNTSKWAKYALDIEKGRFSPPNFPRPERPLNPKGKVVATGKRDPISPTLRGDISGGDGNSRITAPLFWYNKYLDGGGLQKSVEAGVKLGFKRNPLGDK
tara:strand:- start:100 stop:729 length:630 start_codon:yes stop_codon:yes gene_type:complete